MGNCSSKFHCSNYSNKLSFSLHLKKLSPKDYETETEIDQYLPPLQRMEHNLPPLQRLAPLKFSEFRTTTPTIEEISQFTQPERGVSWLIPEIIIHPPSMKRPSTPRTPPEQIFDVVKEEIRSMIPKNVVLTEQEESSMYFSSRSRSPRPSSFVHNNQEVHTLDQEPNLGRIDGSCSTDHISHTPKIPAYKTPAIIQDWLNGVSDSKNLKIEGSNGVIISTKLIRVQFQKRDVLNPESDGRSNEISHETSDIEIWKLYLQPETDELCKATLNVLSQSNEDFDDIKESNLHETILPDDCHSTSSNKAMALSMFHRKWDSLNDSIKSHVLDNLTYQEITAFNTLSLSFCQDYLKSQISQISLYLNADFEDIGSTPIQKARFFHHVWSEMIRLGYKSDARKLSAIRELEVIARLGIWESPMGDVDGVIYLKECINLGCIGQGSFWEILGNTQNRMINVEIVDSVIEFVGVMWDVINQGSQRVFEEVKEEFLEGEMRCAIAELKGLIAVLG
ncbi:hypothetical protein NEOLI_002905 [Neolecta irregularis DAH-3]|uniref:Uncharacterized protein n=1 Tax=Neolecta irregularis (strain DAH-3) TaxID=1198029 RepID=A0A1U7LGH2_NEOID|nr:hypothetical protein NEOLI_002905 [Neolecta irregularis DAH-3]|eukprot:OLL21756.1 hypothetical protein NEOLI_002905 [Neolecta irregularis DAH-3]